MLKNATRRYLKALEIYPGTLREFCDESGIPRDMLTRSIQRHFPERWNSYAALHSSHAPIECPYCHISFVPMNARQTYCTQVCARDARVDKVYFGGRRRETIGLAEGECQLCFRTNVKGLSSHHVLGKGNDPDNEQLIALCPGCHDLLGLLSRRKFLNDAGWTRLRELVEARRDAEDKSAEIVHNMGLTSVVD
jgi:hypothetical protein